VKPIEVAYETMPKDAEAFFSDFLSTTSFFRMQVLVCRIIFPAMLVLPGLVISGFGKENGTVLAICLALALAVIFVVPTLVKILALMWYREYQKVLAASGVKRSYGKIVQRFDNDGIFFKTALGESKWLWCAVVKVISGKKHLHIALAEGRGFAIPRAQVLPETLCELQTTIEEKLREGREP